jgi:DNA-binding PadR family transcriptional regulator
MFNKYGFIPSHWGAFGEGSARSFEKNALKYVLLDLFKDKPAYVNEMMCALKEQSRGMYCLPRSNVYSWLRILADLGYLTVGGIDTKKVYTITDSGRTYLRDNQDSLDLFNTFLQHRFPPTAAG